MREKVRASGRKLVRGSVIIGLLAGAVTATVRFGPTLWRKRAERRDRKIAATTDALWPPVPSKSSQETSVNAPLAKSARDGEASEDE